MHPRLSQTHASELRQMHVFTQARHAHPRCTRPSMCMHPSCVRACASLGVRPMLWHVHFCVHPMHASLQDWFSHIFSNHHSFSITSSPTICRCCRDSEG